MGKPSLLFATMRCCYAVLLFILTCESVRGWGYPHRNSVSVERTDPVCWMGGYYQEPADSNEPPNHDHMIFGVPCKEHRIDLIPHQDPLVVLEPLSLGQTETEAETNDSNATSMRLADHLLENSHELIQDKRVLEISTVASKSWISLLVARLGASSVSIYLGDANDDTSVASALRILQHTDQFINKRPPPSSDFAPCQLHLVEDPMCLDLENVDTVILTLANSEPDVYSKDQLRHTRADILMDSKQTKLLGYAERVQEGASIILF